MRRFVTAFEPTTVKTPSNTIHLSAPVDSLLNDFIFQRKAEFPNQIRPLQKLTVTVCLWIIARKTALIAANKRFEIAWVYQLHFLPCEESEAKPFFDTALKKQGQP
ncbi:hypothetical protein [Marinobacter sp. es.042]|uniref:hypothetical protein n=1 Tax=Marinobacter sp. es.042 TaxID=1761794 RepID=UPI0012FB066C|nr:hypothetical protein [Marinobacter sp. es.042]